MEQLLSMMSPEDKATVVQQMEDAQQLAHELFRQVSGQLDERVEAGELSHAVVIAGMAMLGSALMAAFMEMRAQAGIGLSGPPSHTQN